jgi:hypothetical protein
MDDSLKPEKDDLDNEIEKKRKRKNKKKNLKKDNPASSTRRSSSIPSDDPKKKIKESKVWESKTIPEYLKEKFASLESNPNVIIVANIPINVTIEELREYFNTLLISLKQNQNQNLGVPLKSLEIGETKNFAILEFNGPEWRKMCNTLEGLEYQGFKLMVKWK